MANDTYAAEQRKRAAELAKQRADQARRERLKRIAAALAKNADLKKKMQG